jgi:diaminopimelate epimerase
VELYLTSACGNDFLVAVEPAAPPPPERIRAWCRRGLSLGADGFLVLARRGPAGPDGAPLLSLALWNADGGAAEFSGNGTRCAARLAFELGWAVERVRIETGAGTVLCRRASGGRIELEAPLPSGPPRPLRLVAGGEACAGHHVRVGVPYLVIPWSRSLADAPVARLGPLLRHHRELQPEGANVDWVRFPHRHRLELRVFERGVDAETLASGTGVLAACATGLALERLELPVTALTASGFEVEVRGEVGPGGLPVRWSLLGDARVVARVEPWPGAEASPAPPSWSGEVC